VQDAQKVKKGRKKAKYFLEKDKKLSTSKIPEKSKKTSYTPSYPRYPQGKGLKKWFT